MPGEALAPIGIGRDLTPHAPIAVATQGLLLLQKHLHVVREHPFPRDRGAHHSEVAVMAQAVLAGEVLPALPGLLPAPAQVLELGGGQVHAHLDVLKLHGGRARGQGELEVAEDGTLAKDPELPAQRQRARLARIAHRGADD